MALSFHMLWRNVAPTFTVWCPLRAQGKERHDKYNRSTLSTRMYEKEALGSIFRDAYGERAPWKHKVGITGAIYFVSHVKKPDLDNCMKSIYDAMQGITMVNDSQIVYEEISQQMVNGTDKEMEGIYLELKHQW